MFEGEGMQVSFLEDEVQALNAVEKFSLQSFYSVTI